MAHPTTLQRSISPPATRKGTRTQVKHRDFSKATSNCEDENPTLAAIEAGEARIRDHLSYFAVHLERASRTSTQPRLSIEDFKSLYLRNQHSHGRHFVVHQHDHPISGVHYDLRLQFSETSTISFAIPYGLPGNPNSTRPNRMAIETRVHNLWNNLIESASHATGSLLIWDTGEYEVLAAKQEKAIPITDDELSDGDASHSIDQRTDNEKLFVGFQSRHLRLRLRGRKLPPDYTISLRLPSTNDRSSQPEKPKHKRRRAKLASFIRPKNETTDTESSDTERVVAGTTPAEDDNAAVALASDDDEDVAIRANNAYTGAMNTIGSVHQRNWLVTLDRKNSGFAKARESRTWIGSWEAFYVRGREHERSLITGRSADEIMADEGVEKFVGRKMWRPITE